MNPEDRAVRQAQRRREMRRAARRRETDINEGDTMSDTDPDYDDDDSPKYGTEAERAAGWAAANHAPKQLHASAERRVSMVSAPPVCPECRDGKCGNCDGRALDPRTDDLVACQHRHGASGR